MTTPNASYHYQGAAPQAPFRWSSDNQPQFTVASAVPDDQLVTLLSQRDNTSYNSQCLTSRHIDEWLHEAPVIITDQITPIKTFVSWSWANPLTTINLLGTAVAVGPVTGEPLDPEAAPRIIEICINLANLSHVLTDVLTLPSPGFDNNSRADISSLDLHLWAATYTDALSTLTSPITLTWQLADVI